MGNEHASPTTVWRTLALTGIVALGLASIVGSGGGAGCALAPGPCAGDFPDEPQQPIVEPAEPTVQVGGAVTFSVQTPGLTGATYQWLRAAKASAPVVIAGATGATYTLAGAQLPDDGATFHVSVLAGFEGKAVLLTSSGGALAVSSMPGVVFKDSEFLAADWASAALAEPAIGGPTYEASSAQAGGDAGAYRHVTIAMPGGVSSLLVFGTYQGASYDPATQGAIYVVDLSEECIALPGFLGVGPSLLAEQDGRRYAAGNGSTCDAVWRQQKFFPPRYTARDFRQVDGPACPPGEACPDFSALGKPLRFGFVNGNAGSAGVPGVSGGFGIDNWKVTVWRR
jgi:hypothetical protein